MTEQETYDRPRDTAPPAAPLPSEPYYQGPPARRGRVGLGLALVVVGVLLLAAQLLGGVGFGGGGSYTLVDEQLAGRRLELSVIASDVEVRAWDGDQIRVEAIQHGGSRGDLKVDVEQSGDTVRVTEAAGSMFCLFCSRSVTYRVDVPASVAAEIKTTSGNIEVTGLSGAVSLSSTSGDVRAEELTSGLIVNTASGDVVLSDIAGKLQVDTISGDVQLSDGRVEPASVNTTSGGVELEGVVGALQVGTVSGDITVHDAGAITLNLSSTSGEIDYAGGLAAGASSVSTISGDINLRLPEESAFKLEASSVSGEISDAFNTADAGASDTTLSASSTSGDIEIEGR